MKAVDSLYSHTGPGAAPGNILAQRMGGRTGQLRPADAPLRQARWQPLR